MNRAADGHVDRSGEDERVRDLEDRESLRDLLNRYCSTADRHEWESYAACFTEDATFEGPFGQATGRDAILAVAQSRHPDAEQSQHSMTNMHLSVSGEDAEGTASLLYIGVLDPDRPEAFRQWGGHYSFRFRKEPEGWMISWERLQVIWRRD